MNEREAAFDILQKVELNGEFAAPLLAQYSDDSRQMNFMRTLVQGVLRWRSRLDYVATEISGRSVGTIDQPVLQLLRIGLFQLMFTDVPVHAAVYESVAAAGTRTPRAKAFVNAVLRKATRTRDLPGLVPANSDDALAVSESHPRWLVDRWVATYGRERATAILKSNQELSQADLLVNTGKISVEEAKSLLAREGVSSVPSPFLETMYRLRGPAGALRSEIAAGLFYPMDEGSAAIATLVPVSGRTVADLAAAPGGKSAVLRLRGAKVVSCDVSLSRLQTLRRTFGRMFENPALVVVGDARTPPFQQAFDVVLLDAPCSATGTFRRNPEIKWRINLEQIERVATLQKSMLTAALSITRQLCIYSTCSIEPEENDDVVDAVLKANEEFERFDLARSAPATLAPWIDDGVLRLTPESGTDGFTAFALQRRSRR